jgi:hypothetical protein
VCVCACVCVFSTLYQSLRVRARVRVRWQPAGGGVEDAVVVVSARRTLGSGPAFQALYGKLCARFGVEVPAAAASKPLTADGSVVEELVML